MQISELNITQTQESLWKNKLDGITKSAIENLSNAEKSDFEKASRGFEAIFLMFLLKEMKKGLEKNNSVSGSVSFGADSIMGWSDMLFAEELSRSGTGMGIANMLYKQFTGENLKPITKSTPVNLPFEINIRQEEQSEKSIKHQKTDNHQIKYEKNINIHDNFLSRVTKRLNNYSDIINNASEKHNISENLIKAVIIAESAGKADAISPKGAKGLMQLMDGTAKELGVKNSYNPEENILGGTLYIKQMLARYNNDTKLALAAYNAGPGNVNKYDGIPPFKETQNYIKKVLRYQNILENEQI